MADSSDILLQQHMAELTAYVRLRLGHGIRSRETSADIAQSVCREVLRDFDQFEDRGEGSFRNWLLLQAERKIRDRGRFWGREKRTARAEVPITGKDEQEQHVFEQLRTFFTPSRDAVAREELQRLEREFAALPEDYRQVIVLARIVGLDHEQVAAELGRTPGATRTLLSRALARLATAME